MHTAAAQGVSTAQAPTSAAAAPSNKPEQSGPASQEHSTPLSTEASPTHQTPTTTNQQPTNQHQPTNNQPTNTEAAAPARAASHRISIGSSDCDSGSHVHDNSGNVIAEVSAADQLTADESKQPTAHEVHASADHHSQQQSKGASTHAREEPTDTATPKQQFKRPRVHDTNNASPLEQLARDIAVDDAAQGECFLCLF